MIPDSGGAGQVRRLKSGVLKNERLLFLPVRTRFWQAHRQHAS